MADLKQDLLGLVVNEKTYDELELARLASEPNMNYRLKISQMHEILKKIHTHNGAIDLINMYFSEQVPVTSNASTPNANAAGAQSHSE